jgi:hypothetical protein
MTRQNNFLIKVWTLFQYSARGKSKIWDTINTRAEMWLGYNNAGRISMQIIHLFKQFLSSWTLFICSTIHLRPSTSPRTVVVPPSEPLRLMYERILCLYPVMSVFWSTEKRRYLLSEVDKGKETRATKACQVESVPRDRRSGCTRPTSPSQVSACPCCWHDGTQNN